MSTMAPEKKHKPRTPWAKALVALRKKSGLTQTALGRAVGVGLNTWQRWEADDRNPSGPAQILLNQLLKSYGLPPVE